MGTKFIKHTAAFTVLVASLSSCTGGHGPENIDYLPFQEEEGGKWGMISPDGKVLFSEEFKSQPSRAIDGRFWVYNDQGYLELYTAEEAPKKIGEEYRYASEFYHGKAFVAERDKKITIINRDGETIKEIDMVGNHKVNTVSQFSDGMAVFTCDTIQGMMNFDGDVIIEPKYTTVCPASGGKILASNNPEIFYNEEMGDMEIDTSRIAKADVLDYDGKVLFTISQKQYTYVSDQFSGDYLAVCNVTDGEERWGLIDSKGNEVVKPDRKYQYITETCKDWFVFMNQESHYGVMKFDGTQLVRPEYSIINSAYNGAFAAGIYDENDFSMTYKLIGMDGKTISDKKYMSISGFFPTQYKYGAVLARENKYELINRDGVRLEGLPKIYNIVTANIMLTYVSSDYVDIPELVKKSRISANGLDSLTFNSTVMQTLERQASYYSWYNKPKASDYTRTSSITLYRDIDGVGISEEIIFPSAIAQQNYRNEKVIDYIRYDLNTYWYHINKVPTGVTFRNINPSAFKVTYNNYGPLRGKLRPLYSKLVDLFKKFGTVNNQSTGAILIDMPGGKKAVIYIGENEVVAKWGKLTSSDTNIYRYAGKENMRFETYF